MLWKKNKNLVKKRKRGKEETAPLTLLCGGLTHTETHWEWQKTYMKCCTIFLLVTLLSSGIYGLSPFGSSNAILYGQHISFFSPRPPFSPCISVAIDEPQSQQAWNEVQLHGHVPLPNGGLHYHSPIHFAVNVINQFYAKITEHKFI